MSIYTVVWFDNKKGIGKVTDGNETFICHRNELNAPKRNIKKGQEIELIPNEWELI
jgi:cold shock CspA family protein